MANRGLIYGDAILPRQQDTTLPPGITFNPEAPEPTGINSIISNTAADDSPKPTGILTDTRTGIITDTRISSLMTSTTTSATTTSATDASQTSAPASAADNGMPLGTKLAAIIAPIAFVVVLIPLLYIAWVRHKTRNMQKLASEPRYSPSPSKEPKPRNPSPRHSPKQSFATKPTFLPPLFTDRGTTKEGSLFDEVRTSMESARRNESTGLYHHSREDITNKDSSYSVYNMQKSLADQGRSDSIGLYDLPRNLDRSSPRTDRSSPALQPQRGPSPTLPSPQAPLFDRPPSEAWPLGPNKLPSPPVLYDPHINTNKPLPAPIQLSSPPPNMPLPHPPASRSEQVLSYASSAVLPPQPIQEYRPSSNHSNRSANPAFGTTPIHYQQTTNLSSSNLTANDTYRNETSPVNPAFSPLSPGENNRNRQRDSDLVSELSYRPPSAERDTRRDTDAISMISAFSHRRRRSERDADAMSMISALSPEQEDTPRIPIEHYPL